MVSVAMPEVSSPREQLAERKGERSVRMQAEKKETGRDVVDTSHNVIKQVVYRSRRPELRVFLRVELRVRYVHRNVGSGMGVRIRQRDSDPRGRTTDKADPDPGEDGNVPQISTGIAVAGNPCAANVG